jgi:Na+-exporting ATPase
MENPKPDKPSRSGTLANESSEIDAPAHTFSSADFARLMDVDVESGLSDAQAQERLQRYGANELEGGEGVSWVSVLVSQIG